MNIFSKLFCKHKYINIAHLPCKIELPDGEVLDVPMILFECVKCGKRIVIKENKSDYTPQLLAEIKMWEKHELELNFN